MLFNPNQNCAQPVSRKFCRNVRCGGKLKTPTDNLYNAFCCQGCYDTYFRSRCLVCERPIDRKSARRQVCTRHKCRNEFRRHRGRFSSAWHSGSVLTLNASRNPIKLGVRIGPKTGRPFRQVVGLTLSATSLRLASIPLDPPLVDRIDRLHAKLFEPLYAAKRRADRKAQIERRHPPVNLGGGFRFPNAPVIDLSPTTPPPEWAIPSRGEPTGGGATMEDIPDFLRRSLPSPQLREVA